MAEVTAVAVNAAGYIYVAASDPPVISSTILKLSPDAMKIIYSTFIQGGHAAKLALDQINNVYITGFTEAGFKPTPGAYSQTGHVFAAKLSASGAVQYATYLDLGTDGAASNIAVDSKGQAWIVGSGVPCATLSPLSSDCASSSFGRASAVRALDANGARLLVSRTFGGGSVERQPFIDSALGVAVDATDSVWIVGSAISGGVPTTPAALQPKKLPTLFPYHLGYAVKLSSAGELLYGTYLGTYDGTADTANYTIESVTLDGKGNPYFALNSYDSHGSWSARIMALSADGSTVLLSADLDSPMHVIALDGKGALYTAGSTFSLTTTVGAYQSFWPGGSGGGSSGFAVKFDLTQAAPPSQLSYLVSAAGLSPDKAWTVAPGEIITLFGKNLPPNPKLTFDGRRAPVLYAGANQINAVVPFAVSPPHTVCVVEGAGGYNLSVSPAVPALFTLDENGSGPLAALNQDLSVNSSNNPAKAGSLVAVYMTGVGAMMPDIADGQPGPLQPPFPKPLLGIGATVNGVTTEVTFAGQAPGLIAGAVQVNLRIPGGKPSGNASVIVYASDAAIGYYRSQLALTTIAVE